jgi:hypothetical protein
MSVELRDNKINQIVGCADLKGVLRVQCSSSQTQETVATSQTQDPDLKGWSLGTGRVADG